MANRGLWRSMSTRSKRLLTVSWGVLFVCSLLLQFGLAPAAFAVDPTDPPASTSVDPSPVEAPSTSPADEAQSSAEASPSPSASPSEPPDTQASEPPTPSPSTSPTPSASPSESPSETPSKSPELTIEKSVAGNTGGSTPGGTPITIIGDTLTYSLGYTLVDGPVTNGVVTDVLPAGLEYVAGSATGNAEFTFATYDSTTRTLRWTAPTVTTSAPPGTLLTYKVDVTAENETLPQPRVNVATISSTETPPDTDDQAVTVPTPKLTDFQVVGVCDSNKPYLAYDFTVLNLPGADKVTITFLNPGGANVVYSDQPLSGRVLWPGAVLDASGNVIDWPGWTLNPDGSWTVGDEFDWARPAVSILFEVNPSATLVATYPPASPGCTDPPPALGILKSNDAPVETIDLGNGTSVDLPTVNAGDTVTYTLTYNTNGVPQTNGLLTDVLPAGLTFVAGTASDSDEFTFQGYDASTRTLTWKAPTLTKGGTLTYDVTVDANAAGLGQPLINVATIVSDQQPADDDDSPVYVGTEPLGLTPPPTETLPAVVETSRPGPSLLLILLATLGLTLAIGLITPIPERVRRRVRPD